MKQSTKIIFFGLLSSFALISTCIYFNHDMVIEDRDKSTDSKLIADTNSEKTNIVEVFQVDSTPQAIKPKIRDFQTLPEEKVVKEQETEQKIEEINKEIRTLKVSSLDYKIEKELITIDGKMPILENNDTLKLILMSRCEKVKCDKKIHFSSEQVMPKWKALATETINLFHRENIEMANLTVDGNSICISGEFKEKESMAKLEKILTPYLAIYNIKNETSLKERAVISPVILPKVETHQVNADDNSSIKIVEEKISDILKEKHVNFYRNRAKITKKGRKTLDEIIIILRKQKDIYIEVQGHTDASGKAKTNQWISTQRAKSVKNYLGSRGLNPKNIVAKGFGETRLLLKNKPYSAINRRVEIKIKGR
jgi:outer membrane protein OmpA-like peptidoglycan-associated protein